MATLKSFGACHYCGLTTYRTKGFVDPNNNRHLQTWFVCVRCVPEYNRKAKPLVDDLFKKKSATKVSVSKPK